MKHVGSVKELNEAFEKVLTDYCADTGINLSNKNLTLLQLGLDSLDYIELIMFLEVELEVEIDDTVAEKAWNLPICKISEHIYQHLHDRHPVHYPVKVSSPVTSINQVKKDHVMSKRKESVFVTRTIDLEAEFFSEPTGVIDQFDSFEEQTVGSIVEAINVVALSNMVQPFMTTFQHREAVSVLNLKLKLTPTDKIEIKRLKSDLREILKRWSEKSRVKGKRGWRANAIRTPKFEYNSNGTVVSVQIVLSNVIVYADNKYTIEQPTFKSVNEDLQTLKKRLSKVLGTAYESMTYNHSTVGSGEVL